MNSKQLQLITIVVPLAGLLLVELMRRLVFPAFWESIAGFVTLGVIFVSAVIAFSVAIFRAFDRLQTTVRQQKVELERLYAESQRQADRLRALHEAELVLTSDLALEKVLQRVVDLSRDLLGVRYAALGVIGDDGTLQQFVTSGVDPHTRAAIGRLPVGLGLLGYLMHKGEPIRVDDITAHPESVGFPPNHPPMKTLLGIPLLYKGEILGDIYLADKENGDPFDASDEELLVLFGAQAAAALANARLAQQIEALAVVEERQRFAMDLHDGIIQSIYALGLTLQSVDVQWDSDPEGARKLLKSTLETLDEVIKDIRGYIANLRPGRYGGKSLTAGLLDMAREVRSSGMTQVTVEVEEGADEGLSPAQTSELFHITREALTNVMKHARASRAAIRVTIDDDLAFLTLEISDNGEGFRVPPDGFAEHHHGIRNMKRRASAIGGTFQVFSTPGQGTTVRIVVPVVDQTDLPVEQGIGEAL